MSDPPTPPPALSGKAPTALDTLKQEAPYVWELLVALKELGAEPRLTYLEVGGRVIRGKKTKE